MSVKQIPFQPEMIRALLEGRKTQTRRKLISKGSPLEVCDYSASEYMYEAENTYNYLRGWYFTPHRPGDFLWVREQWQTLAEFDHLPPRDIPIGSDVIYTADRPDHLWDARKRPGMFMPRWASRLTLEVTGVNVQYLHYINEDEAKAEGPLLGEPTPGLVCPDYRSAFQLLWDRVNGEGSWNENPAVVAYTFKVHKVNVDALMDDAKVVVA
jgi:hypothetical protein